MAKGITIVAILLAISFEFCTSDDCKDLSPYDRYPVSKTACNTYFECNAMKTPVEITCAHGLSFDPETKSCIWSNYVEGCGGGDPPPIDDCNFNPEGGQDDDDDDDDGCGDKLVYNGMIGKCVPEGTYVCDGRLPKCGTGSIYDGKFIADKNNCRGYFFCEGNIRYAGECPSGYHFDPVKQQCSHAQNLECTPFGEDPPISPEIDWSNICKGNVEKFIPDPRTCWAYIYCSSATNPRQAFCPDNKFFNKGACTTTAPAECGCEVLGDLEEDEVENVAHADPNKFYLCEQGKQTVTKCPSGKFDPETKSCKITG